MQTNLLVTVYGISSHSKVFRSSCLLSEFKQKNAGKRAVASKSKEEKKKRKVEEERAKSIAEKNKQDKGDEDNEE